jgi:hypothetical protein
MVRGRRVDHAGPRPGRRTPRLTAIRARRGRAEYGAVEKQGTTGGRHGDEWRGRFVRPQATPVSPLSMHTDSGQKFAG